MKHLICLCLLAWTLTINSVSIGTDKKINFTVRDDLQTVMLQTTKSFPLSMTDEKIYVQLRKLAEGLDQKLKIQKGMVFHSNGTVTK